MSSQLAPKKKDYKETDSPSQAIKNILSREPRKQKQNLPTNKETTRPYVRFCIKLNQIDQTAQEDFAPPLM